MRKLPHKRHGSKELCCASQTCKCDVWSDLATAFAPACPLPVGGFKKNKHQRHILFFKLTVQQTDNVNDFWHFTYVSNGDQGVKLSLRILKGNQWGCQVCSGLTPLVMWKNTSTSRLFLRYDSFSLHLQSLNRSPYTYI